MEFSDNYSHQDGHLVYILENIPGTSRDAEAYMKINTEMNSQLTVLCQCDDLCKPPQCSCIKMSGSNNYIGEDVPRLDFTNIAHPILECNSLCSCSPRCGNRLVQYGPSEHLVIQQSNLKGFGVFATSLISRGTFICEYAGEVITKMEAEARQKAYKAKGCMNYIFCLNEHSNGNLTQTIVDPSIFGNIGRYINHSCEPNSAIIPVRVDNPMPKLSIFSVRDIQYGEEITFDYGSHKVQKEDEVSCDRKKCYCQSTNCREWLPFDSY